MGQRATRRPEAAAVAEAAVRLRCRSSGGSGCCRAGQGRRGRAGCWAGGGGYSCREHCGLHHLLRHALMYGMCWSHSRPWTPQRFAPKTQQPQHALCYQRPQHAWEKLACKQLRLRHSVAACAFFQHLLHGARSAQMLQPGTINRATSRQLQGNGCSRGRKESGAAQFGPGHNTHTTPCKGTSGAHARHERSLLRAVARTWPGMHMLSQPRSCTCRLLAVFGTHPVRAWQHADDAVCGGTTQKVTHTKSWLLLLLHAWAHARTRCLDAGARA